MSYNLPRQVNVINTVRIIEDIIIYPRDLMLQSNNGQGNNGIVLFMNIDYDSFSCIYESSWLSFNYKSLRLRGPGGPRPRDGQNRVLYCF